ncbi:tetratricopeptide repeat protein [Streptomyces sp. NPDC014773]|uniref:tetratricopeptide repeat protein n=1 Tax=Streptomyces sp. NPDC014773 TaxID=3364908 RepID=UPI0036FC2FE0
MDAADLDHRARTLSGCIPPELVSRLLERGHVAVVESEAGRGEWFCAVAYARSLGGQGRQADAWELLAPYVATGWWTAVEAAAELLEEWGRADEAIETVRIRMEAGHPAALESYTRLLARHGRAEEAFALLAPHADDWALATALVDVAGVAGRAEEAAELLTARVRAGHHCDGPWCCRGLDSDTALGLPATVRERQGRVDEAVALLGRRQITSIDSRDHLADLLARHGRIEELRAYAASDGHEEAVQRLAELLEERGDPEGAMTVLVEAVGRSGRDPNLAHACARLLAGHGRGDEAIDMMRAQADAHRGDDWILHALSELCLDLGRPADGLAHLDALATGPEAEREVFWTRLSLIAARGGVDEAVERARAHPEGGTWYAAEHIARLLADAGRTAEAAAVLQEQGGGSGHGLATYLIDLDRVDEALAVIRPIRPTTPPLPTAQLWSRATSDEEPRNSRRPPAP